MRSGTLLDGLSTATGVKELAAAFHMTFEDFGKEAQKWGGGYEDGCGERRKK